MPWQELREQERHQELRLELDVASLVPESLFGGGYCFARSLPVVKPLPFFGVELVGLVDIPLNVSIKSRCVE